MPQLNLIHPSRGRPEKAFATYQNWMDKRRYKREYDQVGYYLSLDTDDPTLTKYLELFPKDSFYHKVFTNENKSVVQATNYAAHWVNGANSDVIIYLSDDFDCPQDWDSLIMTEFINFHTPALLKVDDGLQPFHVPVVTIPIMNLALYYKIGYFWYPEYKSMFCDEDLYWTARKCEALRMAPHLKFQHNHYSIGKAEHDQTYKQSEANWNQGKEVFARRKAEGFPL